MAVAFLAAEGEGEGAAFMEQERIETATEEASNRILIREISSRRAKKPAQKIRIRAQLPKTQSMIRE